MFKHFFILLAFLSLFLSLSNANAECVDNFLTDSRHKVNAQMNCVVTAYGVASGNQYRTIELNPQGEVMIFDFFGGAGSKNSTGSGSRTFYFFPIRTQPSIAKADNDGFVATTASGQKISLNKDGSIGAVAGVQFSEDPSIVRSNKGGIEFSHTENGIILDAGWSIGGQSISNRNGVSTFKDSNNKSCAVSNAKLFIKKGYDYQFAFATNDLLANFLKNTCPTLDLSSLRNVVPLPVDTSSDSASAQLPSSNGDAATIQSQMPAKQLVPAGNAPDAGTASPSDPLKSAQ